MEISQKLVRDKIPELMLNQGKTIEVRLANGREYEFMLWHKLQEEVEQFVRERNAEEIADIEEVLHCLADLRGIPWDLVEAIREKKREDKGSFKRKIILEKVNTQ